MTKPSVFEAARRELEELRASGDQSLWIRDELRSSLPSWATARLSTERRNRSWKRLRKIGGAFRTRTKPSPARMSTSATSSARFRTSSRQPRCRRSKGSRQCICGWIRRGTSSATTRVFRSSPARTDGSGAARYGRIVSAGYATPFLTTVWMSDVRAMSPSGFEFKTTTSADLPGSIAPSFAPV